MELFDDDNFRKKYETLRENPECRNEVIEKPIMKKLIGSVENKTILDIGCGYGDDESDFINQGSSEIYAIDISKAMLEETFSRGNRDKRIQYRQMSAEYLCDLYPSDSDGHFDIVVSSLVFHYIEKLEFVFKEVHRLLKPNGIFVFSMEHPIATAPKNGGCFERGIYQLTNYGDTGERNVKWLGTDVHKYHHTVSQVLNAVISAGLTVAKVEEPMPDKTAVRENPEMAIDNARPPYLIVKAKKKNREILDFA